MRIDRFRTVWGIEPGTNLENWAKWFQELKVLGYSEDPDQQLRPNLLIVVVLTV